MPLDSSRESLAEVATRNDTTDNNALAQNFVGVLGATKLDVKKSLTLERNRMLK